MAKLSVSRAGTAQSPSRAKSRKSKTIEVAGHQLTPDLHREYLRAVGSRYRHDLPQSRVNEMALDDVLSRFRPTHTAKDQLMALYSQITAVALGVATLSDYPFFDSRARAVRLCGCDALNRLAAEAQLLGAKIAAIGDAIRHEERENLQDWAKRRAAFDAASAYGITPGAQS